MRRAQRRKYHYFYKTTCIVTGKYYYGIHSTDNLNDGYLGSGKRLWYSINKHGKANHVCEKLDFFETREKLKQKEIDFVNEELINDPLCMNLKLGGYGGFFNEEHRQKFRASGNTASNYMMWNINREHYKKILSDRMKLSHKLGIHTHVPTFKEHKHSEESKRKIGIANSIKQKGEKNSQYGTCWITNEKENKKINKEELIPEGWILGRKIK